MCYCDKDKQYFTNFNSSCGDYPELLFTPPKI